MLLGGDVVEMAENVVSVRNLLLGESRDVWRQVAVHKVMLSVGPAWSMFGEMCAMDS